MQARLNNKLIIDYTIPFLDYCEVEKGLSDNTQRTYGHYLQLFESWLEKTGNADLLPHELTAKHIWNYRLYLARSYKDAHGKHLSKKTQNNYLIALRALLDFLAERNIDTLPSSKVKLAEHKDEQPFPFSTGATSSACSPCRIPQRQSACVIAPSWSCFFPPVCALPNWSL